MPFFTIIMPTQNQGEFIEFAIHTILEQSCKDFELLVYDAESTDETKNILEKYKDRLTWVREKDDGMSDAINNGFLAGTGEVFAWLNSDDAYLPGTFSRVRNIFQNEPDLDFLYGYALDMDRNGDITCANLFTEPPDRDRFFNSHDYMMQPSVFFRKRVISKVGLLIKDLHLVMDQEWFARFYTSRLKGKCVPFFLASNRNYTSTKTDRMPMRRLVAISKILKLMPGRPVIFRKIFWVYALEACLKACNLALQNSRPDSLRHKVLAKCSAKGGDIFLQFVNPRLKNDITQKYLREIKPLGSNIKDLWVVPEKQIEV